MPLVALVVLIVLGYVTMGVVTGSLLSYYSNRYDLKHDQQTMNMADARQVIFFSALWPVFTFLFGTIGGSYLIWTRGIKKTSVFVNGYARYLTRLGLPKDS
jgi:hypothetical protein